MLLAARMLIAAGLERDEAAAETRVRKALESGAALEKFARDRRVSRRRSPRDRRRSLPALGARSTRRHGARTATCRRSRPEHVGRAAVALGAGRGKLDDVIDPGVGIEVMAPVGAECGRERPSCASTTAAAEVLDEALPLLDARVRIADDAARLERPRRRACRLVTGGTDDSSRRRRGRFTCRRRVCRTTRGT